MADQMSEAFNLESIVRRHQSQVWWYLRLLGADAATADDITQDTFVAVLRKPFSDYDPRSTAAYLRTVAKRTYFALVKQQKRSPELSSSDLSEQAWAACLEDDASVEELWLAVLGGELAPENRYEERIRALEACTGVLAPKAQEAIRLRYHDDCSREMIAQMLDMTESGVKSLLQRSRNLLRECIERKFS